MGMLSPFQPETFGKWGGAGMRPPMESHLRARNTRNYRYNQALGKTHRPQQCIYQKGGYNLGFMPGFFPPLRGRVHTSMAAGGAVPRAGCWCGVTGCSRGFLPGHKMGAALPPSRAWRWWRGPGWGGHRCPTGSGMPPVSGKREATVGWMDAVTGARRGHPVYAAPAARPLSHHLHPQYTTRTGVMEESCGLATHLIFRRWKRSFGLRGDPGGTSARPTRREGRGGGDGPLH